MRAWEEKVHKVEPYVPGEQPKAEHIIKLNTNENPYPPSPAVMEELKKFDTEELRLYPDPAASGLVKSLAKSYGVGEDQVFVGVGSDDVLAMVFQTFFASGKPILFPDITYSFYPVWAKMFGIPYECPAVDEDFHMVKEDYYKENGGIIFPNPNAPTALYESLDTVEDILVHNRDVIVVVDEAYIDFGGRSALELIDRYDNLLVVQTFSKSRSMAGMRIGFAVGNPELIRYLNDAKYSFNSYTLDRITQRLGEAAVKDRAYFEDTLHKIINTREWVKGELSALGFGFPDSMANFLFAAHPKLDAAELFQALKAEGIYVRYFPKPRIDRYLRITIGTKEEMEKLLSFLKHYITRRTKQ